MYVILLDKVERIEDSPRDQSEVVRSETGSTVNVPHPSKFHLKCYKCASTGKLWSKRNSMYCLPKDKDDTKIQIPGVTGATIAVLCC